MPRRRLQGVLALDVGTSSCRASVYDERLRRVSAAQARYTPRTTPDGGSELDPGQLFDAVVGTIDAALGAINGEIVAVATASFWHSLMGLDEAGSPLTPVFTWADARADEDAAALRARVDEAAVHARTGCVVHASYWPARLVWLRRVSPDQARRVRVWVSFGEYLLRRLAGQTGVSVSMASGTGLLNQRTCTWDEQLLEAIAVSPEQLPRITDDATDGPATSRWPVLRGAVWPPAVGDGAASNLGAGCATHERFALMVGTSGAERALWQPPGDFSIPSGLWCYRLDARRVVVGGALNDGGSLFGWLRRSLRLPSVAASDAELAAMPTDAHDLTVLPFWAGERSPGWANTARGTIHGLRLHTRPIDILRAALEAVALRFREIDASLRATLPGRDAEVVATGGALLRSRAWLQIMADALGRQILVSSELEASTRGAALLALQATGRLEHPLDAVRPAVRETIDPIPDNVARLAAAAERQRRLYHLLVANEA